jgi:hypothetical protein
MYSKKYITNLGYQVKTITAKQLIKVLSALPEDNVLAVNRNGNLNIYNADEDILGQIDFGCDGEIEHWKEGS